MPGKPEARLNTRSIKVSNSETPQKKNLLKSRTCSTCETGKSVSRFEQGIEGGLVGRGGGEEVAKLRKKLHVISIPLAQKKNREEEEGRGGKGENVSQNMRELANNRQIGTSRAKCIMYIPNVPSNAERSEARRSTGPDCSSAINSARVSRSRSHNRVTSRLLIYFRPDCSRASNR